MKYGILKMAVVIGLVVSSSLALAEGKFTYRQQLQGVDSNPTFGMTGAEKQAWQEEQETIAMCSNESIKSGTKYSKDVEGVPDSYIYEKIQEGRYDDNYYYVLEGDVLYRAESGHTGYSFGSKDGLTKGERMEFSSNNYSGIYKTFSYYEIIYQDIKTDKYDWCVNNGY